MRCTQYRTHLRTELFCFIFGNEEDKDWALVLNNAVNGSDYKDPSEIQINTIKEVLYMGLPVSHLKSTHG